VEIVPGGKQDNTFEPS